MVRKGETLVNIRSGQEMTFLKTWVETNGTQLKIECRSPVTSQREKLHYHPYQENRFTLNQGQLLFTVDGKEILAKAGDTISIPKNVPHFQGESARGRPNLRRQYVVPQCRAVRLHAEIGAVCEERRLYRAVGMSCSRDAFGDGVAADGRETIRRGEEEEEEEEGVEWK